MEENLSSQVSFNYLEHEFQFMGQSGEYIFERLKEQGEFYECDLLETIGESLFAYEGDIVDVGANLGNHTVYFGSILNRKVIAFEPEQQNFKFLQANIRINQLEESTLAYNIAGWDKHEMVTLKQKVRNNFGTFTVFEETGDTKAAPLDDYLVNRQIALIKIDVEGAELAVLNGLSSTIEKSRPIIIVEAHTSKDRLEQFSFFEQRNYQSILIEGRSDNYVWCPEENLNFQRTVARITVQKRRALEIGLLQLLSRQGLLMRRTRKIEMHIEKLLSAAEHSRLGAPFSSDQANVSQEQLIDTLKEIEDAEAAGRRGIESVQPTNIGCNDVEDKSLASGHPILNTEKELRSASEPSLNALREAYREAFDYHAQLESEETSETSICKDLKELTPNSKQSTLQSPEFAEKLESRLSRITLGVSQNHRTLVGMLRELQRQLRDSERQPRSNAASITRSNEIATSQLLMSEIEKLAFLLEKSDPELWNAENLRKAIDSKVRRIGSLNGYGETQIGEQSNTVITPLFTGPGIEAHLGDRVRVGIASMPGREAGLRRVLEIMSSQADEIFVYLNNMTAVPASCRGFANVYFFSGPDLGDRGKFAFMQGFSGYYLTVDDDIEYAPFHVQHIIDGIERYDRAAVVGWHGSVFSDDFEEFYNAEFRKVLSFRFLRGKDTQVHLLGTGVCGFHTDTIDISMQDFIHPNMADVFLAIEAQRQNVPMMVLAHEKDWAKPIDVGPSISTASMKKDADKAGSLDVASTVSTLVKENMPWKMPKIHAAYTRKPMTVAFIGRTDRNRWKKGGILKSAHLTVTALARFGVRTILEDIETGEPKTLSGKQADIIMIYVGDPERPDFKNVEDIIAFHADSGKQVVVNLSINGMKHRSEITAKKVLDWERRWPGQLWLMVFTQSAFHIPELQKVKHRMLLVPKTIDLPNRRVASFAESEGVFIGDIGKLNNDTLLDFPAEEWIAAIRESLPGVKIYAVRQYKPSHDRHLDIDEVWEFLKGDDFADKIGRRRIMVTPVKYATFEMVPLEVAAMGIPVIYPEMPQSLSEHLGAAGVVARTPQELKQILPLLYHDPLVWKGMSQAGIERAESAELGRASSQLYLQLAKLTQSN